MIHAAGIHADIDARRAAAAAEWARAQAARAMARAALSSADHVFCRHTWPLSETVGAAAPPPDAADAALHRGGWADSTLDLRDGLSVVEVFAPIGRRAALLALADLANR